MIFKGNLIKGGLEPVRSPPHGVRQTRPRSCPVYSRVKQMAPPLQWWLKTLNLTHRHMKHLKTPPPGTRGFHLENKYLNYDYRGGGRGSGRVTIGHVIGGAVAKKILDQLGIKVVSHVTQIGNIKANTVNINQIESKIKENPVRCADPKAAKEMEELIIKVKSKGDSIGGVVETVALNAPVGLGEPVFDKLDADLAKAMMGIGSVKGVEIGAGFEVAELTGYGTNDEYYVTADGKIKTTTNQAGGILGGISNGMPIVVRIAVKPTPSISQAQKTVDLEEMKDAEIEIEGRHDPCICPRITAVAEASMAMVLVDHLLRGGFIPLLL